ncbi:hypothetical protein EJD97_025570 [Solanum chilense]|uniref:Uncharacterized protein n=1 Tax=Solanum chilense TaxID=4083 RepID=A0A6N2C051_SOLCI|nr:hypothetical protein EJD97_025570 [Solanum chilense]
MPSHNLINVESCIILSCVRKLHRDNVGKPGHRVHNNPYGVMLSLSLRKTNHEVHINGLPFQCRKLNNLSKTARFMMFCINLFTFQTLGEIFCIVLLYAIPLIVMLKTIIHVGGTYMYGISGTMGLYNDRCPQIIHIWYTQPILVPKYAVISQSKRLIHLNQH